MVHDKHVKFRYPCLNRSREIPPEAIGGGIFNRFLNFDNCQPEVASDVISNVVVDPLGMDVRVKFGLLINFHACDTPYWLTYGALPAVFIIIIIIIIFK